jgi:mannitol/fructose-specific phosphotransferase system IIA component (Ntr-type)
VKIRELIEPEHVLLGLEANDLVDALEAVARRISTTIGVEPRAIVRELLERERLGSTSVGEGFAIPHCKLGGLAHIAVFLARFDRPVEFSDPAERPVRFLFVVLSPPDQPAAHLQVLSQIARVLKRSELRAALLGAVSGEVAVALVRAAAEAEGL